MFKTRFHTPEPTPGTPDAPFPDRREPAVPPMEEEPGPPAPIELPGQPGPPESALA